MSEAPDPLAVAQSVVAMHGPKNAHLRSVIVTGSHVYPEFARPDSDLDLLVVHDGITDEPHSTVLGTRCHHGKVNVPVEVRLFSLNQFQDYVLACDLPKQFAFIRGFRIVLDDGQEAASAIDLCMARYWTDSYRAYCDLRDQSPVDRIAALRFQMTDARNYLLDSRIQSQPCLSRARLAEVVKDFVFQLWLIRCITEAKAKALPGVLPGDALLSEIGLLRVFAEPRGVRILDRDKYSTSQFLKELVADLDRIEDDSENGMLDAMDSLFRARHGHPLFADAVWPLAELVLR